MDTYEQAKKKWAECSMDEWTAGADGTPAAGYSYQALTSAAEITDKFSKMLDFVSASLMRSYCCSCLLR